MVGFTPNGRLVTADVEDEDAVVGALSLYEYLKWNVLVLSHTSYDMHI